MTEDTRRDAEAEALLEEIDREAEEEKKKIIREARDKAAQILAAAEVRIRSATEDASRRTEKLARVDEERLLGQARMEVQAHRMRGMHRAYQRVFEIARQRIDALIRSPRYPDAVKALIREALAAVPQAAMISVASEDREMCRDILRALGKSCQVTGLDAGPGTVVVSTADGKIRVDNSLAARLASAETQLETRIARCLNG